MLPAGPRQLGPFLFLPPLPLPLFAPLPFLSSPLSQAHGGLFCGQTCWLLKSFALGASWKDLGRDLCSLGLFRTWGGGGAGGAASWYSAYPCSDHPVGCLAHSARITGLLRVGLGPISPCIPSPRVARWPTPSSSQPPSGGLANGEGHRLGWVQLFYLSP